jgi:hypothetical protein
MVATNMIVTLVAETRRFSSGLGKARKGLGSFSTFARGAVGGIVGAIAGVGLALVNMVPDWIAAAEEARKADKRLQAVADSMGIFGSETGKVTKRLGDFANSLQLQTGIEDEVIKGNQAILLTFKSLAKSAGIVGGAFDRATVLTLDLAEVMKTDSASAAKQLGKALENPVKGLTALTKSGITFTDAEKAKIKALVESGRLLEAQDMVLKAIETQVGGTAEATASAADKMKVAFSEIAERLGTALLPAVDKMATQFADWLESPSGKKALNDFVAKFEQFGAWITSPEGTDAVNKLVKAFEIMLAVTGGIVVALGQISKWLAGPDAKALKDSAAFWKTVGGKQSPVTYAPYSPKPATNPTGARAPVINFYTPIDSVSAGREVARVLADYNRVGGMTR